MATMAGAERERSSEAERGTAGSSVMAVDYGKKRIGLAVANEAGRVAGPLTSIERKNRREDLRRLREIVREHGVRQIVVGHPLRLDGTRSEMALEAERFAERLQKHIGVPVELVDERLTSWEAEQLLSRKKGERKKGGSEVDAVAAAVILRDYLASKTEERR